LRANAASSNMAFARAVLLGLVCDVS
jgi:hypothetical protein